MNHPRRFLRLRRSVSLSLLLPCLVWLACCPPAAQAAKPGNDAGMRLLQAQLPAGGSLRQLDVDHLVSTLRGATVAHRQNAVAILAAALTLDEWDARRKEEKPLTCPIVALLFRTSARIAPDLTATLLETAQALHPECADALTAALRGLETNNTASASNTNGVDDALRDGSANNDGTDGGGLDGSSPFGGGPGPGFPGSPGFGGSAPSGGFALPTPVPSAVTPTANN